MENPKLHKAKQLARSCRKDEARLLLVSILREDRKNATAWLWMSEVVDGDDKKRICLENVLTIQPENIMAIQGLELLKIRSPQDSEIIQPLDYIESRERILREANSAHLRNASPETPVKKTWTKEAKPIPREFNDTKFRFQPRYLTFIGGLIAGFGVLLVWDEVVRHTESGTYTVSSSRGFESIHGLLVLAGAIALCVISLVHKTKPLRPSSPYSVLIGIFLLFITFQKSGDYTTNLAEYLAFRISGEPYTSVGTSVGIYWSAIGLLLAIFGAAGINPGSGRPDWTTYLAVGFLWALALLSVFLGGMLGFASSLICALPVGIFALFSTFTVIRGRQRASLKQE